ncbi:fibronectin type III domain-containing protein [Modestobacter sp. L9-4]|uniref:fibronectin type III domain-containing protein n=1 Tax=Modestobacter sp. L9-4 TaxID=2851567 RepID=UPI001C750ABF|nr:fibronectin type III domain-containing protein [Modestobacter sp. L9-4]QXG77681.1 fibronectin type III domain-containing protein [Modestobacter sp. L9-4]
MAAQQRPAQRRPAPGKGTRPAAGRTTRPAARRPQRRPRNRLGWLAPALLVGAVAVIAGVQVAPVVVELTASGTEVTNGIARQQLLDTTLPDRAVGMSGTGQAGMGGEEISAVAAQGARSGGFAVPQPPRPVGITVPVDTSYGVVPRYTPRPDPCGSSTTPRRIVPNAVAGPGSATVTWLADSREEVLSYRVSAVSQELVGGEQAGPVPVTVARPATCSELSATITGLVPGDAYVIWMEEEVRSRTTGVARMVEVGISAPVVIG